MKTLEQINALLEVLDSDNVSLIDELQKLKADIEKPKGGIYVPEVGESYGLLLSAGSHWTLNEGTVADISHLVSQIVYRTEEEAERADRKRIAEVRYIRLIAEANDGWWPDWKDDSQGKWAANFVYLSNRSVNYAVTSSLKHKDSYYYAKSQEAAQWAVEQLTEDEIELIFKS